MGDSHLFSFTYNKTEAQRSDGTTISGTIRDEAGAQLRSSDSGSDALSCIFDMKLESVFSQPQTSIFYKTSIITRKEAGSFSLLIPM